YGGILLVLVFLENWFVYHPTKANKDWREPPDSRIQNVELTTIDGTRIHAWWLPRDGAKEALLYCHGNAGNLSHPGNAMVGLGKTLGVSVLIFDYPGYGKSEGRPSETGCYAAGEAAYDWLAQKVAPQRILLYGGSLGGGVAVELASRKPHRALILLKTFTSLPDVGQRQFRIIPVRWLMRNRFDNLAKIGKCRRPVFFGHGTTDTVVPYALGQRLYEAANEPKRFFSMPGVDHNDPVPVALYTELAQFLKDNP